VDHDATNGSGGGGWRPLSEYLALDDRGGRLTRDVGAQWTFGDSIFGGYSAALLVAGTAAAATLPELLAASVTFVGALAPGPVEVTVEPVLDGYTAWIGRAVLSQGGAAALVGEAWFGRQGTLRQVPGAAAPPPGTTSLDWFTRKYPFMGAFDERASDYPRDESEDIAEPPARVGVWARAATPLAVSTPLERQLFSLMLIDGHIIDAAVRPHGNRGLVGLSHNLTVHWTGMPASDGWYEFTAEALGHGTFAATRAVLSGAGGDCAWAMQQGRLIRAVR
jgi:hypothetical protein